VGRQTILEANSGTIPVAPSPIPCPICSQTDIGVIPKELTEKEIEDIIQKFGQAALRAKIAGFDAIEVHGAHGYLIGQFLSPLTNKRQDAYGGSFEKRISFALKVIQKLKGMAGDNFPIIFRLNAEDSIKGGLTIEDAKQIAIRLEYAGVSAISVSSGIYPTLDRTVAPLYYPPAFLIPLAAEVKKMISVPVIGVGRIPNLALADEIISKGEVDLVAMGRPLIADPELVSKSKNGNEEDIRPCIYCNFCGTDRLLSFMQLRCAVNAEAGRETEYALKQAPASKNVLVIGGGPGGMEAARVAALRGHMVTLVERGDRLGGQLLVASVPSFKRELQRLSDYLSVQINKAGVEVKLGMEVVIDDILKWNPDVVILATGVSACVPDIPGADKGVTAVDILKGISKAGERVIMCGGGSVGCETSLHLAQQGKKVTLVEMLDEIAGDLEFYSKNVLIEKLKESKVKVITGRRIVEVTSMGVIAEDKEGQRESIEGGTVAFAMGSKPDKGLSESLKDKIKELYAIGDCVRPGRVHNAIQEAAHVARQI
jgi:2,4-dienoyl-CoA reductase-like NADH-dependent reductase (Old Yellow Enzyme family)/thioredoxin reductase